MSLTYTHPAPISSFLLSDQARYSPWIADTGVSPLSHETRVRSSLLNLSHRLELVQTNPASPPTMGTPKTQIASADPYAWPHDASLSPSTTALIIIDMQRDCTPPSLPPPPPASSPASSLQPRRLPLRTRLLHCPNPRHNPHHPAPPLRLPSRPLSRLPHARRPPRGPQHCLAARALPLPPRLPFIHHHHHHHHHLWVSLCPRLRHRRPRPPRPPPHPRRARPRHRA